MRPALRRRAIVLLVGLAALLGLALVATLTGGTHYVLKSIGLASSSPAPANDDFASATDIGGATSFSGTTAAATTETAEPNVTSGDSTVWYRWTPTHTGPTYFTPASAGPPPTLRVYTGSALSGLTAVDTSAPGDDPGTATVDGTAGTVYYLQLDAPSGSAGAFSYNIDQPVVDAPENDDLLQATDLGQAVDDVSAAASGQTVVTGTTVGATAESGEPGGAVHSVWYSWTAPTASSPGQLSLSVAPATQGDALHLVAYQGSSYGSLKLVAGGPSSSAATIIAASGDTYSIQVDGDQTAFNLTVAPSAVPGPDTTAPTINCSPPTGWVDDNPSIPCTATDTGSGLADPTQASFHLTTTVPAGTSTDQAVTGSVTVCDTAGNCATAGPLTGIRVDRQGPQVACAPTPATWSAHDVTIACTANDGVTGSGLVDQGEATFTLTTSVASGAETASASFGPHPPVCDTAGNCTAVPAPKPALVDEAAPAVVCPPGPGGWQKDNVVITCTVTDGGSGVATRGPYQLTTSVDPGDSEPSASTGTLQICDLAGNCNTAGPVTGLRVDRQAPTIKCTPPSGWIKGTTASILCTATDTGSGLNAGTDSTFDLAVTGPAGGQGTVLSATRRVCDDAGNCATAGPYPVQLDDRAPTITCQPTPTSWQPAAVTVDCQAGDAGSGLADSSQETFEQTGHAPAGQVSTTVAIPGRQVCDAVGNCSSTPSFAPGRADDQTPLVTCSQPVGAAFHAEVTVACTATDQQGSGLADAADASFDLGTSVGDGHADGAAYTGDREVCDSVGNCTEVGPFGPYDVDRSTAAPGAAPAVSAPDRVEVLDARPAADLRPSGPDAGGIPVPFDQPSASSDAGLPVSVGCSPRPGAVLPLGLTEVSCGAGDTADRVSTAIFGVDVVGAPTLAPTGPAIPGRKWLAVGTGFAPDGQVAVELDGVALVTGTAAGDGSVSAPFAIPAATDLGPHLLVVRGAAADGSPRLVVTPIEVARTSPPTTTTVPPTTPTSTPPPTSPSPTTSTTLSPGAEPSGIAPGAPKPVGPITPAQPVAVTGSTTTTTVPGPNRVSVGGGPPGPVPPVRVPVATGRGGGAGLAWWLLLLIILAGAAVVALAIGFAVVAFRDR